MSATNGTLTRAMADMEAEIRREKRIAAWHAYLTLRALPMSADAGEALLSVGLAMQEVPEPPAEGMEFTVNGQTFAIEDAEGHLHGETDGRFVGNGETKNKSSDVQRYTKERKDSAKSIIDQALKEIEKTNQKIGKKYSAYAWFVFKNMTDEAISHFSNGVNKINFLLTQEDLNDKFNELLVADGQNPISDNEYTSGWYDVSSKTLFLSGAKDKEGSKFDMSSPETYAHEFSHAIDSGAGWISSSKEWKDAWREEIYKENNPLSAYATTHPEEGFAEFGRLIFTGMISESKAFPKCCAIWKKWGLI